MCPACLAAAALIAAGVASTGGLAVITIKRFSVKNAVENNSDLPSSERLEK
jgi:hypothetical protein